MITANFGFSRFQLTRLRNKYYFSRFIAEFKKPSDFAKSVEISICRYPRPRFCCNDELFTDPMEQTAP